MNERHNTPPPIPQRLMTHPRRTAGMDSHREPVRLGEIGSDGHLVGYIHEHGLAWESLTECLSANLGTRLAEALVLPDQDLLRNQLIDQVAADVPDELISGVAQEAAGQLWLSGRRPLPWPQLYTRRRSMLVPLAWLFLRPRVALRAEAARVAFNT